MIIQIVDETTGNEIPVFYHENLNSIDEAKGFLKALIRFRPIVAGCFWDEESSLHGTKKFHFEIIDPIDEFESDTLFASDSYTYETGGEYQKRRYREHLATLEGIEELEHNNGENYPDYSNI